MNRILKWLVTASNVVYGALVGLGTAAVILIGLGLIFGLIGFFVKLGYDIAVYWETFIRELLKRI